MQVIERILHMLRVKDCRHVCLFCEYYDMCKQEIGSRKEVKERGTGEPVNAIHSVFEHKRNECDTVC